MNKIKKYFLGIMCATFIFTGYDTEAIVKGTVLTTEKVQEKLKRNTSKAALSKKITIKNLNEYKAAIKKAIENFDTKMILDIKKYNDNVYNLDLIEKIIDANPTIDYGYSSVDTVESYYGNNSAIITYTFKYDFPKSTMLSMKNATQSKAKKIIASIIKPNMSDVQKELAIHDYIINNAEYDNRVNNTSSGVDGIAKVSYTPYGVLVKGTGVCESYAKAMCLLCKMAGIECLYITGEGGGVAHAWNIVKVGGSYYQVDVTFDDPTSDDGEKILLHDYFNVTDSIMAKDHTWTQSKYPKCTATKYKYSSNMAKINNTSTGTSTGINGAKTTIPTVNSLEQFANLIEKYVINQKPELRVKIKNYSDDYAELLEVLEDEEINVGYEFYKEGDYYVVKFEY